MKQFMRGFVLRGMVACGLGPLVLAVFYLLLQHQGLAQTLTIREVCLGIFTLSGLAFLVGGMNGIYQIERLPLMVAILIHGGVLYAGYLVTYLLNGWLERSVTQILVFSGIFGIGYLVIWAVIYSVIRKKTERINRMLKEKQQSDK